LTLIFHEDRKNFLTLIYTDGHGLQKKFLVLSFKFLVKEKFNGQYFFATESSGIAESLRKKSMMS